MALPDGVPLTRPQADRLSALCRDQASFCVAVVDHGSMHVQTLLAYVAQYRPPPPSAVLQVHIDAEICSTDAARLGDRLMTLANDEWLSGALGPDPLPADVAATALRLVEFGRETPELIDLTPVEEFCGRLLGPSSSTGSPRCALSLRGEAGDRALRLAAYRIALAVFDGLPGTWSATRQRISWTGSSPLRRRYGRRGGRPCSTTRPRFSASCGRSWSTAPCATAPAQCPPSFCSTATAASRPRCSATCGGDTTTCVRPWAPG